MPDRMNLVEITGRRQARVTRRSMPQVGRDYALIKVMAAPMCNEYVAYSEGVYLERNRPDSLGHEMAGEVVQAPAESALTPGDRVVALCGYPCGRCEWCRRGYYSHCPATEDPREVCGSETGECGFAQYAVKPAWMLEPVPDDLSYSHAAMACCGLGPTFGAMERMRVRPGDTVLVTGLGAVGLGGVINAKARGARVVGAVRSAFRRELAEKLGCDHVIGPSLDEVLAVTGGRGADHVIECSGQPVYHRLALASVARMGQVAFLAEPGRLDLSIDEDLVQRGVTLLGSLDINRNDVARLLNVVRDVRGLLDLYITHRLPLDRVAEAFEEQASHRTGKVVLFPHNDEVAA
uniref:2-deoxy-scyllo-inosamine dehydrogenase n=1 Tax=Streptomyces sp. NBC_00008 TaxID=2903610 RepID=A0AAU2VKU5_9ACTN